MDALDCHGSTANLTSPKKLGGSIPCGRLKDPAERDNLAKSPAIVCMHHIMDEAASLAARRRRPPHIYHLVADDMGYDDLSHHEREKRKQEMMNLNDPFNTGAHGASISSLGSASFRSGSPGDLNFGQSVQSVGQPGHGQGQSGSLSGARHGSPQAQAPRSQLTTGGSMGSSSGYAVCSSRRVLPEEEEEEEEEEAAAGRPTEREMAARRTAWRAAAAARRRARAVSSRPGTGT